MKTFDTLVRHDGNRSLFDALAASILSLTRGLPLHFHVEGLRGTGKTTIIRSAPTIMPDIERIAGCRFNCDPSRPHCPEHRDLGAEDVADLGTETVPMPFLEISHSAKIGTVVGSIDLEKLTDGDEPEAALRPGTLARAHRGVVFVDEINRLTDVAPELVDVLLDVMGTKPGRIQIEESGLPKMELPVRCCVWAASNPDEEPGPLQDIRRQLSDRFDFLITTARPTEACKVRDILTQAPGTMVFGAPGGPVEKPDDEGETPLERLGAAAGTAPARLPEDMLDLLAYVYVNFNLESLRAMEGWAQGAAALATLQQDRSVSEGHLRRVAPWVLHHRTDAGTLSEIVDFFEAHRREGTAIIDHGGSSSGGDSAIAADRGGTPASQQPKAAEEDAVGGLWNPLADLLAPQAGDEGDGPTAGAGAGDIGNFKRSGHGSAHGEAQGPGLLHRAFRQLRRMAAGTGSGGARATGAGRRGGGPAAGASQGAGAASGQNSGEVRGEPSPSADGSGWAPPNEARALSEMERVQLQPVSRES